MDKTVKMRWQIKIKELEQEISELQYTINAYHGSQENPSRRVRISDLQERIRKIKEKIEVS